MRPFAPTGRAAARAVEDIPSGAAKATAAVAVAVVVVWRNVRRVVVVVVEAPGAGFMAGGTDLAWTVTYGELGSAVGACAGV